jgi:hypothetical protein
VTTYVHYAIDLPHMLVVGFGPERGAIDDLAQRYATQTGSTVMLAHGDITDYRAALGVVHSAGCECTACAVLALAGMRLLAGVHGPASSGGPEDRVQLALDGDPNIPALGDAMYALLASLDHEHVTEAKKRAPQPAADAQHQLGQSDERGLAGDEGSSIALVAHPLDVGVCCSVVDAQDVAQVGQPGDPGSAVDRGGESGV